MKNKKLKANLCSYALITCVLVLAGCSKPLQQETVERICVPDMDKAVATQVAEDVLVKMHFTIDKIDPNTGFIRTHPLSGAQFFEFWRKDNVGSDNATLANLHTVRRIAELDVSRQDEKLCIACDVQVYRLSLPQRESTSRALAPGMFSESSQSTQVLQLRSSDREQGRQAPSWVNIGRDEQLETNILTLIEKRLIPQTGRGLRAMGDKK
jgi:hypothetical protein